MDRGDQPTFKTHNEELQYWKDLAERLAVEKDTVQKEFDDYTTDSQQLEKEYEATIDQNERTIKELKSFCNRNQNELESLRIKLEQSNRENIHLQAEINTLKNEKLQMKAYIRELEQKNDDLERAERMVTESVATIEASLHLALEKNALLESEVDEKETLREKLQRLADESRDLRQELQVKERCPDNDRLTNCLTNVGIDSNRLKVEHETQTTPLKRDGSNNGDTTITPSTRILALNIVSDLLRRIGKLDAQLKRYQVNGHKDSLDSIRRHSNRGSNTTPPTTILQANGKDQSKIH